MIEPRALVQGAFGPDDIIVTFSEQSNRLTNNTIDRQVDELWEQVRTAAEAKGKRIWNGITYRTNSVTQLSDGRVSVEFAPLDYKTRECVIQIPGYYELPETYWRKGAYTSSFVKTADNYYVFGELSGRSLNQNRVDVLGGIIDEELHVRSGNDLFTSLYKEIEEESAIPAQSIKTSFLNSIFLNHNTNVGFHFSVQLFDSKDVVEQRFRAQAADEDVKGLVFIPEQEVFDFVAAISPSKRFLAELLLQK